MAEKKNKKKGGSGKFFLGAALGAIAGAVAGKFFSDPEDNKCKCGDDCNCKKPAAKKPAAKKTAAKKTTKKTTTKAKK